MKLIQSFCLAFAFMGVFGAIGSPALAETNACMFINRPGPFRVIGDNLVEIRADRIYRLSTEWCSQLPWARHIEFRSGSPWVCDGDFMSIYDGWGNWMQDCRIRDVYPW